MDHAAETLECETGNLEQEKIAFALLDAADLEIDDCSGLALQEATARNRPRLVPSMLECHASLHLSGRQCRGYSSGRSPQSAVESLKLLALMLAKGANTDQQVSSTTKCQR